MLPDLERVKGIHPGAILKRELKKRGIRSIDLANEIDEYPQTINAITKERRGVNAKLSIELGGYFEIPNDYFMILQACYEVNTFKNSELRKTNPLLGKIRRSIFWDTNIELIDIEKHRKFIIQRILERGNKQEIKSLIKIYTLKTIKNELPKIKNSFIPNYQDNIRKYIEHDT